jgi:hypothetical protein
MIKERKNAPTEYCLALRSDLQYSYFLEKENYAYFFCVEKEERLIDWVLALRMAKVKQILTIERTNGGISKTKIINSYSNYYTSSAINRYNTAVCYYSRFIIRKG